VAAVSIVFLAGCIQDEVGDFAPGRFEDSSGDVSLVLLVNGESEATNLPYWDGESPGCSVTPCVRRYTGPVQWAWNSLDAEVIVGLPLLDEGWTSWLGMQSGSSAGDYPQELTFGCDTDDFAHCEVFARVAPDSAPQP
jgi:hypothetical protein